MGFLTKCQFALGNAMRWGNNFRRKHYPWTYILEISGAPTVKAGIDCRGSAARCEPRLTAAKARATKPPDLEQ
jgi:hypothetical protein